MFWKNTWTRSCGELCLDLERPGAGTALENKVEALYEEHCRSVWRYLTLTGSSPEDAEEWVQETFLRLFRHMKAGGRIQYPKRWLLTAAHRVRLDECEKQARRPLASPAADSDEETVRDPQPDPETALIANERRERLQTAMQRLTSRQCEYLNLRAEGLRLKEIASLYGVTVQSVAETCSRAVSRLEGLADE